ncbi:MAG TPA: GNAT family N-acetyltransferase [Stellaceae bacterium]|nr:GNAT family N-acetyltransferase [Stellaceae bacterium]
MQLPSIETTRLRLRHLEPKDAAPLRDITDDPAITGAIQFLKSPFTASDALKLIESRVSGVDCFFGLLLRESDQLIGVMGAGFTDDGEVEIGYWIGTSFQREGYAQEAGRALLDLLARQFPRRSIIAVCKRDNHASRRVLEKLGFKATGEASHRPDRERFVLF